MTRKTSVSADSKLKDLVPILSADDLIVHRGRLHNSELDNQLKHPIILPNKSRFTELLIEHAHKNKLHHSGHADTLTQIREQLCIIRNRQTEILFE